jgi:hypothetical protein
MFKGEYTRKVVDRAYIREDIKKILDVSDLTAKIIVLLMVSSGLRIGGLPHVRIRNLEKMNSIYKITVLKGLIQSILHSVVLNALLILMLTLILEPTPVLKSII